MTILQEIIEKRKLAIEELKQNPIHFEQISVSRPSLYTNLMKANQLQVIAEIKRASPSKGMIAAAVDPIEQAKKYEAGGAACISVLTESHYFKGSYADLNNVAKNVAIPVLCKDFIVDVVQIDVAKAAGASVILLIVAALPKETLQTLYDYATGQDLEVLVEVHTPEELALALSIGAKIIGVNNRNLKTFKVDLAQTEEIAHYLNSSEVAFISESGIQDCNDAIRVAKAGAKGVLVGETLMRSEDPSTLLQMLKVPLFVGESL